MAEGNDLLWGSPWTLHPPLELANNKNFNNVCHYGPVGILLEMEYLHYCVGENAQFKIAGTFVHNTEGEHAHHVLCTSQRR